MPILPLISIRKKNENMRQNITQAEAAARTIEKPVFRFWPTQIELPHYILSVCTFKGIGKRKNYLFLSILSHLPSHPLEREPRTSSAGRSHGYIASSGPASCLLSRGKWHSCKCARWSVRQDRHAVTQMSARTATVWEQGRA